jgi:hypothetical protein
MKNTSLAGQGPGFPVTSDKPVNGCHDAREVLVQRLQELARCNPERYTLAREKLLQRFGSRFFDEHDILRTG